MLIIILNNSRKKSFRQTKRIISAVLPSINNRLSIGNLPKRIILDLIKNIKEKANRGTSIQIFIEESTGYHGFKLVQIGKLKKHLDLFEIETKLDKELIFNKIIKIP
jgi:hypothetical protein